MHTSTEKDCKFINFSFKSQSGRQINFELSLYAFLAGA